MNKHDSKNKLPAILLVLSLIIIFSHAFFYFQQKSGYYLDEALSFQLANDTVIDLKTLVQGIRNNNLDEIQNNLSAFMLGSNIWKTHEEIVDRYTISSEDRFSYLSPYLLQASDVHPPLYYFIIRTISSYQF